MSAKIPMICTKDYQMGNCMKMGNSYLQMGIKEK